MRLALLAPLALLAAPAAAQTSGCVRDASGSLVCSMSPSPVLLNSGRRISSTRDLAAAAQARGQAQAQAVRETADRQLQAGDERAGIRPRPGCTGNVRRASPASTPCR